MKEFLLDLIDDGADFYEAVAGQRKMTRRAAVLGATTYLLFVLLFMAILSYLA